MTVAGNVALGLPTRAPLLDLTEWRRGSISGTGVWPEGEPDSYVAAGGGDSSAWSLKALYAARA
jgi:hypothetical protein